MPVLKRFLLRAWARGTHIVEHEAGLLAVLYLLNLAPIAWFNIHMYKGEQLGVLTADAVFLLGGVLLYVLLLGGFLCAACGGSCLQHHFSCRCSWGVLSSFPSCSTVRSSGRAS